jgi:acyl dehydratase
MRGLLLTGQPKATRPNGEKFFWFFFFQKKNCFLPESSPKRKEEGNRMESQWRGPYRVRAFNTASESENSIHSDAVARRFGFTGGLVPGVDVFAYMAHLPVLRWGRDWLARGRMTARFSAPVYDGEDAIATGDGHGATLEIAVASRGVQAASGRAGIGGDVEVPARVAAPPPPMQDARPVASEASLLPGRKLGIRPVRTDADMAANYLRDVRETDPLYRTEGLLHPGLLLRTCNWALIENVRLGPWIHAGSTLQNLEPAPVGATLTVTATVTSNHVRKGHAFVELDATVLADGRPVCLVHHVAIWRPRQLRAAGHG